MLSATPGQLRGEKGGTRWVYSGRLIVVCASTNKRNHHHGEPGECLSFTLTLTLVVPTCPLPYGVPQSTSGRPGSRSLGLIDL